MQKFGRASAALICNLHTAAEWPPNTWQVELCFVNVFLLFVFIKACLNTTTQIAYGQYETAYQSLLLVHQT